MDPGPFLRGNPFPPTRSVPYPRAKPGDGRIPGDTWYMATFPVGVRLELTGTASAVDITYEAKQPQPTWPLDAGRAFESWRGSERLDAVRVEPGTGVVRVATGAGETVIYIPERLAARVDGVEPVDGSIEPGPARPRFICYGDSIAEGWNASSPALAWPSVVAREHGLDLVNMAYAAAGRGETPIAEQIAALPADVIVLSHGTNCWERTAHTAGLMRESMRAFLLSLRAGHPATPIVVVTAPLRPAADDTPNVLGASLEDLRRAQVEACAGFDGVTVLDGRSMIDESMLDDGLHPNDAGHAAIAAAVGSAIASVLTGARAEVERG